MLQATPLGPRTNQLVAPLTHRGKGGVSELEFCVRLCRMYGDGAARQQNQQQRPLDGLDARFANLDLGIGFS